ncbi:hypothetical protein Q7P37_005493 [Cladosporium fusiforme]
MKLTASMTAAMAMLLSQSLAAPTTGIATSNPLADFPKLTGFDGRPGFASVDPDGVYRAYLADGTVVDAARLTSDQVQTWIDARAPLLSEADATKERQLYTGIDGQNVSDDQLLAPAEDLQPKTQLKNFAHDSKSARDMGPLIDKRQISCPSIYCLNNYNVCRVYGYAKRPREHRVREKNTEVSTKRVHLSVTQNAEEA